MEAFISFNEARAFLGFSESYMYKLTASGMLPVYRPTGKTLFFRKSELEAWVKGLATAPPTRFEQTQQAAAASQARKSHP